MLVVQNAGLNVELSHQWERSLGCNCLHCCPSSLGHLTWRGEGVRSRVCPQRRAAHATQSELGLRQSLAPRLNMHQKGAGWWAAQGHSWGTAPTLRQLAFPASPRRPSVPSPQAAEKALLRTCVPPAATQDTRGRSSARVPCCSPRSHTVSW